MVVSEARGVQHPDFGILTRNLAQIRFEQGNFEAAFAGFTKARSVIADAIPNGHLYWHLGRRLAATQRERGNWQQAAPLISPAAEALRTQLGADNARTQHALREAVLIFGTLGDEVQNAHFARLLANN